MSRSAERGKAAAGEPEEAAAFPAEAAFPPDAADMLLIAAGAGFALAAAAVGGAGAALPGAGGATPIIVCFKAERAAAEGRVLVAALGAPAERGDEASGLTSARGAAALEAGAGARDAPGAGWLPLALAGPVPSTTIAAPQRLQVMRTFRPRTLSSGTAYLAGQLPHWTFMSD